MSRVLGVDGCPGGWCVVEVDTESLAVSRPVVEAAFVDVLVRTAETICADIPIGMLCGARRRECDEQARRLLGQRRSSVFDPPCRHALQHSEHPTACAANQGCTSRGLSIQAFNIANKIRDVDEAIATDSARRVFEVHPELCFLALNSGRPLMANKGRLDGRGERWDLLRRVFPDLPAEAPKASQLPGQCEPDDYIDALACAWTAVAMSRGTAIRIPEQPELDELGVQMEMWLPG